MAQRSHFVCFDPDTEGLESYLAGAREHLDIVLDQSETGMEIVSGTHRYVTEANWKLLLENGFDGYHLASTHKTYFQYLSGIWPEMPKNTLGTAVDLGNGHVALEHEAFFGRPIALWSPLFGEEMKDEIDDLRRKLIGKHGEKRGRRICDKGHNFLIFPNLVILDTIGIVIRVPEALEPGKMMVSAWQLAPKGESPALRAMRLNASSTFFGPGGFSTPDDVEVLELCQQGFEAGGVEWSDASCGMHNDQARLLDEFQLRVFWRGWLARMMERRLDGKEHSS
uniref:Ring hydroxylating alpha subunit (Catalytic domain) n=1 Tax=Candidatus Kentrum sp. LPFa TaxID=2126335 RepID=A0A450X9Y7_9GAMM|nr:MAG: Ring hydroxylating alpha subunit (catalytic domain) [Candidatus Kentron sp. LPFa]VFK26154.1 MAG: Ring hydroxylating alpha subunit (catalytic domain) [Candidatus Kentron sp. LPFa]